MIVEDSYSFDLLFKAVATTEVEENEWTGTNLYCKYDLISGFK